MVTTKARKVVKSFAVQLARIGECGNSQTMKPAPHAVDIRKWQGAGVSAISEQDKHSLLSGIVPAACTGEAGMAKTVTRKIRAGGGVF